MFVTENMIAEMKTRYGMPVVRKFRIPTSAEEVERIRSSKKNGRNHDVTVYVRKDDNLVVIAKHQYPRNLYRSPSGGVHPGEDIETGLRREISEELGCEIAIDRFLMITQVEFVAQRDSCFWRSFVFTADYVSGDFAFTDHREIREVKLVDWSDFDNFGRIMRQSRLGGLYYRAALHEAVVDILRNGNATPPEGSAHD